jgi:cytoskeletal protein RodZ
MKFGEKLRDIRENRKITKYKVRKDTHLQYSQIDAIENNENYSIDTLIIYLEYFSIKIKLLPQRVRRKK